MPSTRIVFAGLLVALACTSSSTGPNPNPGPDLGFLVQVLTAPPGSTAAGTAVPILFKILHKESDGATTPVSGKAVTFSVTAGGGTVGGGSTTTVTSGGDGSVAITWQLGTTLGAQTLRGSVSATEFADVSVTATQPPASQLVLSVAPSGNALSGAALAQQPAVQLKDAGGANVPEAGMTITATILSGGGTLSGTTTVNTNASGAAVFSNLAISGLVGNRTLRFTATLASGTATVTSGTIALAPGAAADLTVKVQPSANAGSGAALSQQPAVQLRDAATNNAAQAGVVVTATVATGTATLQGSTTATTDANGVATFVNLALNGATGPVTLRFTATLLGQQRSATSGAIALVSPAQLTIARPPTVDVRTGIPFFKQPRIHLADGAGNPVTQDGVPVTVSVVGGRARCSGIKRSPRTWVWRASPTSLFRAAAPTPCSSRRRGMPASFPARLPWAR